MCGNEVGKRDKWECRFFKKFSIKKEEFRFWGCVFFFFKWKMSIWVIGGGEKVYYKKIENLGGGWLDEVRFLRVW